MGRGWTSVGGFGDHVVTAVGPIRTRETERAKSEQEPGNAYIGTVAAKPTYASMYRLRHSSQSALTL